MKFFFCGTAQEFRQELAAILRLPPESGDLDLRAALKIKGSQYVAWYDTRMRAIRDSDLVANADASKLH